MKLKRDDKVMVMAGRDKGRTGKVLAVLPTERRVLVEGVNVVKRATKPSQKNPRGGILDVTKPIDVSKVMVIDPVSGKPARVGYQFDAQGHKERVFKVSQAQGSKPANETPTKANPKPKPTVATKEAQQ